MPLLAFAVSTISKSMDRGKTDAPFRRPAMFCPP
jgi:hypothetical protein